MNRKDQKPSPLLPKDTTNTLGIKVYPEQCIGGIDNVLMNVSKFDNNTYDTYAIVHNKEGKPHIHIALRLKKGKTQRVSYLLGKLGIVFRDEDTLIMINRGLETLGSFKAYLRYLTHTDEESIKANKKKYDPSEFVTNMDRAVFSSLLGNTIKAKRLTKTERLQHDCHEAYKAGYGLWNYSHWNDTKKLDFISYSNSDQKKIREFFKEGQVKRYYDGLPQIVIAIDIPQNLKISVQRLKAIIWNALEDIHIYPYAIPDINDKNYFELKNSVGLGIINTLNPLSSYCTEIKDNADLSRINQVMLNEEYNVSISQSPYRISGGMTYTIVLINDPQWIQLLMSITQKTYYCCTIDPGSKSLVFKDADKRGAQHHQQDRKDLYINFRDAFNLRLQSFSNNANLQQVTNQVVDYSDL